MRKLLLPAILALAAIVPGVDGQIKSKVPDPMPRALYLAPARPPMTIFTFAGRNELVRFESADALANFMGKEAAGGLADQVDFTRENIVLVSWTTHGTPDGTLAYEVKKGAIQFYVQGPGGMRGLRTKLAADFFAVPRDTDVEFDAKER